MARLEAGFRPFLTRLPPSLAVRLYSRGRGVFLPRLAATPPRQAFVPPAELAVTLWGVKFRSPILNAAGMFKNGEGYALVARQGGRRLLGRHDDRARALRQRAGGH